MTPEEFHCIAGGCDTPPVAVVTIERNGVLGHYGTCAEHIAYVAGRVNDDHSRANNVSPLGSFVESEIPIDEPPPEFEQWVRGQIGTRHLR